MNIIKIIITAFLIHNFLACSKTGCDQIHRGDTLNDVTKLFGEPLKKYDQHGETWFDFYNPGGTVMHLQVDPATGQILTLWCGDEDLPRWDS